jgi:hypothetical protein
MSIKEYIKLNIKFNETKDESILDELDDIWYDLSEIEQELIENNWIPIISYIKKK